MNFPGDHEPVVKAVEAEMPRKHPPLLEVDTYDQGIRSIDYRIG